MTIGQWYRKKVSEFQLYAYKHNLDKNLYSDKRPFLYNKLADYRRADAIVNGQCDIVATGDSIMHGGEPIVEDSTANGNRKIFDSAIGGDRARWLYERALTTVAIYKPKTVITHICGNDTWGNRPLDLVLLDLRDYVNLLKASGVQHIGWMEILPLGYKPTDSWNKLNFEKIPHFNAMVEAAAFCDYIPLRKYLAGPNGWVRPEYNCGDAVHINEEGYRKGFMPAFNDYLTSVGM